MRDPLQYAIGDGERSEPIKRLSVNLPESLHTRFKLACVATNRKMLREIREFVERRTEEIERKLEDETGLGAGGRVRPVPMRARLSGPAKRRLKAIDRALACNHPTGDIDEMLADIERGRDLR